MKFSKAILLFDEAFVSKKLLKKVGLESRRGLDKVSVIKLGTHGLIARLRSIRDMRFHLRPKRYRLPLVGLTFLSCLIGLLLLKIDVNEHISNIRQLGSWALLRGLTLILIEDCLSSERINFFSV